MHFKYRALNEIMHLQECHQEMIHTLLIPHPFRSTPYMWVTIGVVHVTQQEWYNFTYMWQELIV